MSDLGMESPDLAGGSADLLGPPRPTFTRQRILDDRTVILGGVSSEDYAFVYTLSGAGKVVPLLGGAATTISSATRRGGAVKSVIWAHDDRALVVWSAAGGKRTLDASSGGPIAVTDDGAMVAYLGAVDQTSNSATVFVARVDGATPPKPALTGVAAGGNCGTRITAAGDRFVVAHCTPAASQGEISTVVDIDLSGAVVELARDVRPSVAVDVSHGRVAVRDAQGALRVVPLGGGQATPVATGVVEHAFLADGALVVLSTPNGRLSRVSATGAPGPIELSTTGCDRLLPPSSDGRYVACTITASKTIALMGAEAAGTARVLGTSTSLIAAQTDDIYDAFSSDGSWLTWLNATTTPSGSIPSGTLTGVPVGGGAERVVAPNVFFARAFGGARVGFQTGGLYVVDLASSAAPILVDDIVQLSYFRANPAGDAIVWVAANPDPAKSGVWVAPMP